jgi:phospholipase/carboxylesterase
MRHSNYATGRLTARPPPAVAVDLTPMDPGVHVLNISATRNPMLYLPRKHDSSSTPTAMILTLHGAGGDARDGLQHLQGLADQFGVVLLSAASRGRTWDVIGSGGGVLGPDVEHIDAALSKTFSIVNVDISRIALSGFSDGASYALTVGLANGDLFTHILAFSPGFMRPPVHVGKAFELQEPAR